MGRHIQPELHEADTEARRYVISQWTALRGIWFPSKAAFAKEIAERGALSLPPTPADPRMEHVGRFFVTCCKDIERKVIAAHYGEQHTRYVRAHRLSMNEKRFDRIKERVLWGLRSWLLAIRE